MSLPLLGLPLELALRELAERGMDRVTVNRLLAPRRAQTLDEECGEWRVVRVCEGETVALDVCLFAAGALVGAAIGRPPEVEKGCVGGD